MKTRSSIGLLALVIGVSIALSWTSLADTALVSRQPEIRLAAPRTSGGMSLTEALAKRRSQRSFQDKPLSIEQIAQLCWAAQGITEAARGFRTAPSAKSLYPIRVFIIDEKGAREYLPRPHALRDFGDAETLTRLRATMAQPLSSAPAFMVLAMEPAIIAAKLPKGAERYSLIEAGHVAQNVLLQATAMNLASVPVGGIDEAKVATALSLPEGQRPVYVLPLGYPGK